EDGFLHFKCSSKVFRLGGPPRASRHSAQNSLLSYRACSRPGSRPGAGSGRPTRPQLILRRRWVVEHLFALGIPVELLPLAISASSHGNGYGVLEAGVDVAVGLLAASHAKDPIVEVILTIVAGIGRWRRGSRDGDGLLLGRHVTGARTPVGGNAAFRRKCPFLAALAALGPQRA